MAYDVTAAQLLDELNKMQRRALAAEEELERLRAAHPAEPVMSDQSLREALEKLAGELEYDVSDAPAKIRALLAAHPVEPTLDPISAMITDRTAEIWRNGPEVP